MAKAPAHSTESDLEATESECLDCGTPNEPQELECVECGSDALEYFHVTYEPLGYDDDAEYHIAASPYRRSPEQWSYMAKEPSRA